MKFSPPEYPKRNKTFAGIKQRKKKKRYKEK
jgi:hypothetical protein